MTATDLHRPWCGCRDTTTPCTRDSLVSKDTKVYLLALVWTAVSYALLCAFTQIPFYRSPSPLSLRTWSSTLHLSRSVNFLSCWVSPDSRDFTSLRLLWIVVCYEISRFRLGRGVVVKLVISLTLKGEINNITLNNTLWFHYTTVYRLATVDSWESCTNSTKQQLCQAVSVWV